MSQDLKNLINLNIPDNETRSIKPVNIRNTLNAIVDYHDELTLDDLDGVVANTGLSGTYSEASLKTNGVNTVFSIPGSGSVNTDARSIINLCEMRSNLSNTVGAIVFVAPTTAKPMFQFEIDVGTFETPGTGKASKIIVQGYYNGTSWESLHKITVGNVETPVRVALKSNKICVILGDTGSSWRYPHITVASAKFSHSVTDDFCKNWTSEVVTSMSSFLNISDYLSNSVEVFSTLEKNKLASVANGATANDTDANLKNRANHTGTQAISTVENLQTTLNGKAGTAVATTSTNGLMSSTDKVKLNAVGSMANRNITISENEPEGGNDGDIWLQV